MQVGGSGSVNGLANIAPGPDAPHHRAPDLVSADDEKLMLDLLALLSVLPNMSFVSVYKTMLAEQTGDNAWLNVRAPLDPCWITPRRKRFAGVSCNRRGTSTLTSNV
jgi:4-hydroxy-tetrahydrodipicolinate synthase